MHCWPFQIWPGEHICGVIGFARGSGVGQEPSLFRVCPEGQGQCPPLQIARWSGAIGFGSGLHVPFSHDFRRWSVVGSRSFPAVAFVTRNAGLVLCSFSGASRPGEARLTSDSGRRDGRASAPLTLGVGAAEPVLAEAPDVLASELARVCSRCRSALSRSSRCWRSRSCCSRC